MCLHCKTFTVWNSSIFQDVSGSPKQLLWRKGRPMTHKLNGGTSFPDGYSSAGMYVCMYSHVGQGEASWLTYYMAEKPGSFLFAQIRLRCCSWLLPKNLLCTGDEDSNPNLSLIIQSVNTWEYTLKTDSMFPFCTIHRPSTVLISEWKSSCVFIFVISGSREHQMLDDK